MKKVFILTAAICFVFSLVANVKPLKAEPETKTVMMGTGDPEMLYYQIGGAIAKMVNAKQKKFGVRCIAKATKGSVYNIDAVLAGELDFAVVQSDRQHQAWMGLEEWKNKGRQGDLRAVLSLYTESVTLVAAEDSGIKSVQDLKGKRINIGNPGSGERENAISILEAYYGMVEGKDFHVMDLTEVEASKSLQNGQIDAFFCTVGHPSKFVREATEGKRKVRLIPLAGARVDRLLIKRPYYIHSVIPIRFYPGATNTQDVPTFGPKATLVTSVQVPDEIVYTMTVSVFENIEKFKKQHPVLQDLTRESMVEGMSASTHTGAARYYQKVGLRERAFRSDGKSIGQPPR